MLSSIYTFLSLAVGAAGLVMGAPPPDGARPPAVITGQGVSTATFAADLRAVSNWRQEALHDLHPTPLSALAVVLGAERPVVTRCVKLNNYWCIKRARWNGEIGFDDEGHVGFASAEQGADAAVRLLRRYYLEFGRKSALDIVRRWAPAECRVAGGGSVSPAVLTVGGIGNTLRARWLAARKAKPVRTKVAAAGPTVPIPSRPAPSRVSAVPLRPLPTLHMPSIMAGVSAPKPSLAATLPARVPQRRQPTPASVAAAKAAMAKKTATRTASMPAPVTAKVTAKAASLPGRVGPSRARAAAPVKVAAAPPPRPEVVAPPAAAPAQPPVQRTVFACGSDEQRIQNYAGRIVRGLDVGAGDDLKLFEPDGRPLPNLARVLLAMSSFELGYLHASAELIEDAVARATPRPAPAPAPEQGGAAAAGPVL